MHGQGRFFDPRLNDATKFPIAAANGFGDLEHIAPEEDRVTPKLPGLHFYQLALPAPEPRAGKDFDAAAAERGDELFSGKARCNDCHVEPLWTEPGWNLHKPEEIGIDSFQADRAPDNAYKTMSLAGVFVRENGLYMRAANKGRFYHDGPLRDASRCRESLRYVSASGAHAVREARAGGISEIAPSGVARNSTCSQVARGGGYSQPPLACANGRIRMYASTA